MPLKADSNETDNSAVAQMQRCSSCGSALAYDPGKPVITCNSCGNYYNFIEPENKSVFEYLSEIQLNRFDREGEKDDQDRLAEHLFSDYNCECPSCGGTIENVVSVAGKCPFCGNAYYRSFHSVERKIQPAVMFPFKISGNVVSRRFSWWYKFNLSRILFLMRIKFLSKEKVEPCYFPVWIYTAKAKVSYSGRVTPTPVSESRTVSGEFVAETVSVPVHSLLSYEGKLAEFCTRGLAWNLSEPVKFNPALIAGIQTKPFFRNSAEMMPRASRSLENAVVKQIKAAMGGAHQEILEYKIDYSEVSYAPALIPVWKAVATYRDKPVWFCMNGLSGKFIGRIPSPPKNQVVALGAVLTVLFTFLAGYLQYRGGVINTGTVIFAAVFSLFSMSSICAGLRKVFSMKLSLWLAAGVNLFYLFISMQHIRIMILYHAAVFAFIGLLLLFWKLSSSGMVDESEFEDSDISQLI